jgi:hypothetical protein
VTVDVTDGGPFRPFGDGAVPHPRRATRHAPCAASHFLTCQSRRRWCNVSFVAPRQFLPHRLAPNRGEPQLGRWCEPSFWHSKYWRYRLLSCVPARCRQRSFAPLTNGDQNQAKPWPKEGHADNLIDARASSYCFQEIVTLSRKALVSAEAVLGPRSRKGASARCCSASLLRGSWSGLGLALLIFSPSSCRKPPRRK